MENVVIEINGVKHKLVSGKAKSEDSCLDFCSLADYCLCLEDLTMTVRIKIGSMILIISTL